VSKACASKIEALKHLLDAPKNGFKKVLSPPPSEQDRGRSQVASDEVNGSTETTTDKSEHGNVKEEKKETINEERENVEEEKDKEIEERKELRVERREVDDAERQLEKKKKKETINEEREGYKDSGEDVDNNVVHTEQKKQEQNGVNDKEPNDTAKVEKGDEQEKAEEGSAVAKLEKKKRKEQHKTENALKAIEKRVLGEGKHEGKVVNDEKTGVKRDLVKKVKQVTQEVEKEDNDTRKLLEHEKAKDESSQKKLAAEKLSVGATEKALANERAKEVTEKMEERALEKHNRLNAVKEKGEKANIQQQKEKAEKEGIQMANEKSWKHEAKQEAEKKDAEDASEMRVTAAKALEEDTAAASTERKKNEHDISRENIKTEEGDHMAEEGTHGPDDHNNDTVIPFPKNEAEEKEACIELTKGAPAARERDC